MAVIARMFRSSADATGGPVYPACFEYADPATVDEAIAYLGAHADEDVKVLAGGQSLIPLMKLRFARPDHVLDINRIDALRHLRADHDELRIGALVRESELEADPVVRSAYPILHDATRVIADPVVRNLATVGGNLAHGDPANDHPAVMVALDASLVTWGPRGHRVIPADEFFVDLFETALEPDELLTEIRVRPLGPGTGAAYVKFERQAGDYAVAAVAARVTVDDAGVVTDARLVFTGVGERPQRVEAAEQALLGQPVTPGTASAAGATAAGSLRFDDDLRGPAAYKARVAAAVTRRAVALAGGRATGTGPA
jgi:carbon-monoxide dehydrogenase medium subunit